MLRPSRTTGSLRELARASQAASENSSSNILPAFLRPKMEATSWLHVAEDSMHPNLGLHHAAATGNIGLVKFALDNGQPPTSLLNGILPLHAACSGGDEGTVQLLLKYGANVNAARGDTVTQSSDSSATDGSTPLHFAAANGHVHIVRLLLEKGAHPTLKDKTGATPEALATSHQHPACASLIRIWIATKGPCVSGLDEADAKKAGQSEDAEVKGSPRTQRSFDSFSSAATSIKATFRAKRKSQMKQRSTVSLLSGTHSFSPHSEMPPLPPVPGHKMLLLQEAKSSSHRRAVRLKAAKTVDAAYQSRQQIGFPSPLEHLSDDYFGNVIANTDIASLSKREEIKTPLSATVQTLGGADLSINGLEANDFATTSTSFLPSLESSVDSSFGQAGQVSQVTSQWNEDDFLYDSRRGRERSKSDAAVETFSALEKPNSSSSPANRSKLSRSSVEALDDTQELLEASADVYSPSDSRVKTCSAASGNHRRLPRSLHSEQRMSKRSTASPSIFNERRSNRADSKSKDASGTEYTRVAESMRARYSSRIGTEAEKDGQLMHIAPERPVTSGRQNCKETKGSLPPPSPLKALTGNECVKSYDQSMSSQSDLPITDQAQMLVESMKDGIKSLSQKPSQHSLTDMLAAYGEALALQRKASTSTVSTSPIVRKASSDYMQNLSYRENTSSKRNVPGGHENDKSSKASSLLSNFDYISTNVRLDDGGASVYSQGPGSIYGHQDSENHEMGSTTGGPARSMCSLNSQTKAASSVATESQQEDFASISSSLTSQSGNASNSRLVDQDLGTRTAHQSRLCHPDILNKVNRYNETASRLVMDTPSQFRATSSRQDRPRRMKVPPLFLSQMRSDPALRTSLQMDRNDLNEPHSSLRELSTSPASRDGIPSPLHERRRYSPTSETHPILRKLLGEPSEMPREIQATSKSPLLALAPYLEDSASSYAAPSSPTFSTKSSRRAKRKVREVLTGLKSHLRR